jgi:hypothetical protein
MLLEFVPALLSRSATLLRLLLQHDAIDLELASCVVAVDPGLTFAVLQLANAGNDPLAAPVWQLPSALVAAGREPLQTLLHCSPRVESAGVVKRRLTTLTCNAVVRAAIAQLLARELGCGNPKKAFLAGLLLEIPELVALSRPHRRTDRSRLLAAMVASLPGPVVNSVISGKYPARSPGDALHAVTILSEALRCRAPSGSVRDLLAATSWRCWPEYTTTHREALLEQCVELALLGRRELQPARALGIRIEDGTALLLEISPRKTAEPGVA